MGRRRDAHYFSDDPNQLSMAGVRPDAPSGATPQPAADRPKPTPVAAPRRKRRWLRKIATGASILFLGSGGFVGFFAEGTRDALREMAISFTLSLFQGPSPKPHVETEASSIATAPPPMPPSASPIDTGSIEETVELPPPSAKRVARRKPSREETNPFIRFGRRIGEAVDEFFGYPKID